LKLENYDTYFSLVPTPYKCKLVAVFMEESTHIYIYIYAIRFNRF